MRYSSHGHSGVFGYFAARLLDGLALGALLPFLFFRALSDENIAIAIGISAGTFLAIATADILPQIHRIEERNLLTLVFLVLGLTVSWIGRLVAH